MNKIQIPAAMSGAKSASMEMVVRRADGTIREIICIRTHRNRFINAWWQIQDSRWLAEFWAAIIEPINPRRKRT